MHRVNLLVNKMIFVLNAFVYHNIERNIRVHIRQFKIKRANDFVLYIHI